MKCRVIELESGNWAAQINKVKDCWGTLKDEGFNDLISVYLTDEIIKSCALPSREEAENLLKRYQDRTVDPIIGVYPYEPK